MAAKILHAIRIESLRCEVSFADASRRGWARQAGFGGMSAGRMPPGRRIGERGCTAVDRTGLRPQVRVDHRHGGCATAAEALSCAIVQTRSGYGHDAVRARGRNSVTISWPDDPIESP